MGKDRWGGKFRPNCGQSRCLLALPIRYDRSECFIQRKEEGIASSIYVNPGSCMRGRSSAAAQSFLLPVNYFTPHHDLCPLTYHVLCLAVDLLSIMCSALQLTFCPLTYHVLCLAVDLSDLAPGADKADFNDVSVAPDEANELSRHPTVCPCAILHVVQQASCSFVLPGAGSR